MSQPFQRISYIVNPASQNGATGRNWHDIVRHLPAPHEVLRTQAPGDAVALARAAANHGADLVVSVGGDGTLNEVTSGLMLVPQDKRPALGMMPQGTGGDFRRTLGYPKQPAAVGAILARGQHRMVDVGEVSYTTHSGSERTRHFINIASFGLSGVVDEAVNGTSKALGGKLSFLIGSVRGILRFKPVTIELSVDGAPAETKTISLVGACNGRAFGGGMFLAPTADPGDGLLDIVSIAPIKTLGHVLTMLKIYKGEHLGTSLVSYQTGKSLVATSRDNVLIDIDGEALGKLPLRITLIPAALRFVC